MKESHWEISAMAIWHRTPLSWHTYVRPMRILLRDSFSVQIERSRCKVIRNGEDSNTKNQVGKGLGNKGQFVRRARILAAGYAKDKSRKDGFCGNKRRQKMRRSSSNNIYLLVTMTRQLFGPVSIESSAMLRVILDSIWDRWWDRPANTYWQCPQP
jgi:hypothetical protein